MVLVAATLVRASVIGEKEMLARGGEEEIGQVVRAHVDLVYSVAVRATGDRQMAEDVSQEVFIVYLRREGPEFFCISARGW